MARMIPSVIDPSCASPGEREIFRRLRDDPQTLDWIVLHSLDLSRHPRQVSGEADFVIIVPHKGVLCLEVKAHRQIRREADGLWYFGREVKGDPRSPFKQAAEARYAIREALLSHNPELSRIVFWSAVIMPYVEFRDHSIEWHDWQVVDSRAFRSRPLGALLNDILDNARQHLKSSSTASWFFEGAREPYPDQCQAIAERLRPSFECHESPKARAERQNAELLHYTEEQFSALDAMEQNPRVAFTGPAGTGKTLLAIEAARRSSRSGRRVLFVCFNKLLEKWVAQQTASLAPGVTVRTLHSYMQSLVKAKPEESVSTYWEIDLPSMAIERLLEEEAEANLFDELIIDEAQDLLRGAYLDFLDLCIRGGLATGRWRLFGDFEKQKIYSGSNLSLGQFLKTRGGDAPRYGLRVNCRNTPRIAGMAEMLGGLDPGYQRYLRSDDNADPEVLYYRDAKQQEELLVGKLQNLYDQGFAAGDIVILSTKAEPDSMASRVVTPAWKDRLRPYERSALGYIKHSSIHAFKGLESAVIVVTDVERVQGELDQELLYVAATRALHRLVILAQEGFREDLLRVILSRTDSEGGA